MERQIFTIGWLSLSAILLVTGICVVSSFDARTAEASGMTASAGRYTMIVGSGGEALEMVYILDNEAHKLLAYRLNPSSRRIERTASLDIDDAAAAPPDQKNMRP